MTAANIGGSDSPLSDDGHYATRGRVHRYTQIIGGSACLKTMLFQIGFAPDDCALRLILAVHLFSIAR